MAQNKKQHFVPKFLLRHFSIDENRKLIGVYNVNSGFHKADCPLVKKKILCALTTLISSLNHTTITTLMERVT